MPPRTRLGPRFKSRTTLILVGAVWAAVAIRWALHPPLHGSVRATSHSAVTTDFAPTISNPTDLFQVNPKGMVWIPGGEFSMGAQGPPDVSEVGMQATRDSRPIHRVY